jgi:hypothetical protein
MHVPAERAVQAAKAVKNHWSHFFDSRRPYLVEKSIANTPRALFFEQHFQPAYFIHIVRNGYAVAEGIRRKGEVMPGRQDVGMREYPIEWCAQQWRRSLEVVETVRPKLKRFIQISYEDLTADPDKTLRKICDFVGADHLNHSLKESPFEVHGARSSIKNMNGDCIRKLHAEQIIAINSIAGEFLKRFGYFYKPL